MFEEKKEKWLNRAQALKPKLFHETVKPVSPMPGRALSENDGLVIDFGNHWVGFLTLSLSFEGSHPDAPAWLSIKLCENERELNESLEGYQGWISKSWVQLEQLHVDVLPAEITLPRRYAFRYVKIHVLGLSSKYKLIVKDASVDAVTSANEEAVQPLAGEEIDRQIDRTALRTLRGCMQDFFEDGPKRDRRLWMGDLRLQALTNYVTFKNTDLVKRCLYLFAGTANEEGRVAACLFTEPAVEADDTYMFDYSLFFIPALLDYCEASGDEETKAELTPVALRQLALAEQQFDQRTQLVNDSDKLGWCFVDWALPLNKQLCAQAIWIYCAKAAQKLCFDPEREQLIASRVRAARAHLYDKDSRLFVSGSSRQISWASQVWAVLAGIAEGKEAAACLDAVALRSDAIGMVTPYMMHHYAQALCLIGRRRQALEVIRDYWGAMVKSGADTFWELFNPANPDESPYGSAVVNSYCHAWSCTPAWFLRSGILED